MKKQLLAGLAIFAVISVFSQNPKSTLQPRAVDMSEKIAHKFNRVFVNEDPNLNQHAVKPIGPVIPNDVVQARTAASSYSITWKPLSGSMNIYGMLEETSKCLQYNNELNAVSFVHRKSATYQPSPFPAPLGAETGAIVSMLTQDWGAKWDSTCVWNNNTNWARYPQGGIYSAAGNTNIANAYIVASGPLTPAAGSWIGSYLASKQLDTLHGAGLNNIASVVPNAQQFIANTPPFGSAGKFDYPSWDFTSTDDGLVRTLGQIVNDFNSTTALGRGFRGARVLKGVFNSGVFNWIGDSVIISAITLGSGAIATIGGAHMAWNEAGNVGYVWVLGSRQGATGANIGYQPIVYKTTNSGTSWSLLSGINFNNPAFKVPVLDHIPGVSANPTLTIPFFNPTESMDCTVDKNDKLHIVSTIIGTSKSHQDSLLYSFQFPNADGEVYTYAHVPGQRPYIYDFIETATGWTVAVVDSMSTEAPGERSGDDGYAFNPWDASGGSGSDKVRSNASLQLSRTADGKYVIYTWAESDTAFTDNSVKWNQYPDIKARMMNVGTGVIHNVKINVTNPSVGSNPLVTSRAQMHHIAPKCAVVSSTNSAGVAIGLPMTLTNNQNTPLTQLSPNTHWYTTATLNFDNVSDINIKYPVKPGKSSIIGVNEQSLYSVMSSLLFPNPTRNSANLSITLNKNSEVKFEIMNTMGQVLKSSQQSAVQGENTLTLDLRALPNGVYLVNVSSDNASSMKKIIIE